MRCWAVLLLPLVLAACGKKTEEPPPPPPPQAGGPIPLVPEPTNPEPEVQPAAVPAPLESIEGRTFLIITNASSDFWNAVDKGMTDAAAELGVAVRMERNDGTVEGQIRLLEQALSQKDGLAGVAISLFQADAPSVADKMKELIAAGIPLITVDSDGPRDSRCAFVGTNNVEAGKELGRKAIELAPFGWPFCTFVGTLSAQNARERTEGFQEGAGDNFDLVEEYQDEVDFAKARENVATALASHPEAKLLVGLWSYNGPLIAEVVAEQGKSDEVTVICFDAAEGLLPLIESGQVKASAVQNPYMMGFQSIKLLKAYATGDSSAVGELLGESDVHDTGITIVTPDNFAEFKAFMDEKGLTSS